MILILDIIIILIILLISKTNQAPTDCIKEAGKNGEECHGKSTFLNMEEWNFIYEEDQLYVCCYYKGKIGNNNTYEGCYPFYADYILNNKVNNLLDDMEKGKWELALNIPYNEPSINCFSIKINNLFNIQRSILFILFLFF